MLFFLWLAPPPPRNIAYFEKKNSKYNTLRELTLSERNFALPAMLPLVSQEYIMTLHMYI